VKITELNLDFPGRTLPCLLAEPERLAADPLLVLTFYAGRHEAMNLGGQNIPAQTFVAHGHRALSFDLPHHGDRVGNLPPGIDGFREGLLAGVDPFIQFVADGMDVIDTLSALGIAHPGRIAVCGVSRLGLLRLPAGCG